MSVKNALLVVTTSVALLSILFAIQQHHRLRDLEARLQAKESRSSDAGEPEAPPTGPETDTARAWLEEENKELREEATRLEKVLEETRAEVADLRASEKAGKGEKPGAGSKKGRRGSPLESRPDTLAEARLLASLERYFDDVPFLSLEDLSEREREAFGPYADRMAMIRGADGNIGLFGLLGEGKALSDIPADLEPWVDAYAAVSFRHDREQSRVVEDLISRRDTPRFSSKGDALRYQTEQRAAFYENEGRRHAGWIFRSVEGEIVLVDRETLGADPALSELRDARDQIRTRINDGEEQQVGMMEKWVEGMPDEEDDASQ